MNEYLSFRVYFIFQPRILICAFILGWACSSQARPWTWTWTWAAQMQGVAGQPCCPHPGLVLVLVLVLVLGLGLGFGLVVPLSLSLSLSLSSNLFFSPRL